MAFKTATTARWTTLSSWLVTPYRRCLVRSLLQPPRQVLQVGFQVLPVVLPRLAVNARCGIPLEVEVRLPQHVDVVHVMKQRSESHLLVSLCYLPYSLQPTYHPGPALSPESGGLSRIPLGT